MMTDTLVMPKFRQCFDWDRLLSFIPQVLFHSGRTDPFGGHWDVNNVSGFGHYHFHHGYGPHAHDPNCPFGLEKKVSLLDLLNKHNAAVRTIEITHEEAGGEPTYSFEAIIVVVKDEKWLKLQFGDTGEDIPGFYTYTASSLTMNLVEEFDNANLEAEIISVDDSPWRNKIGGIDVLVNESYFYNIIERVLGAIEPGDSFLLFQDWLKLYRQPTVIGNGRVVELPEKTEVEGKNDNDWYSFEMQTDIGKWVKAEFEKVGIIPIVNIGEKGEMVDENGRYWIAIGPKVLKPEFADDETADANHFNWKVKIDAVLKDADGNEFYLPCVPGDIKRHTYSNGFYQTGLAFPGGSDPQLSHADGSVIEFMGVNPTVAPGSGSLHGFKLDRIIVYEN